MIDLSAFHRHDAANAVQYEACTKVHTQAAPRCTSKRTYLLNSSIKASTQDRSVLQDGRIGISIETLAHCTKSLFRDACGECDLARSITLEFFGWRTLWSNAYPPSSCATRSRLDTHRVLTNPFIGFGNVHDGKDAVLDVRHSVQRRRSPSSNPWTVILLNNGVWRLRV